MQGQAKLSPDKTEETEAPGTGFKSGSPRPWHPGLGPPSVQEVPWGEVAHGRARHQGLWAEVKCLAFKLLGSGHTLGWGGVSLGLFGSEGSEEAVTSLIP